MTSRTAGKAASQLALHLMTLQFFAVMRDPTLASVPFFLFMGYVLEQSGLMERLFRGVQLALATVRGSLYLAVLITATIFAAATGIVGSSVMLIVMGPVVGVPATDLFAAAVVPGLLLSLLYIVYTLVRSYPDWDLKDIYAGMMQFMMLQVIGLVLVLLIPELALWLPRALRD